MFGDMRAKSTVAGPRRRSVVGDSRLLHAAHANRSGLPRTLVTIWYPPAYDRCRRRSGASGGQLWRGAGALATDARNRTLRAALSARRCRTWPIEREPRFAAYAVA